MVRPWQGGSLWMGVPVFLWAVLASGFAGYPHAQPVSPEDLQQRARDLELWLGKRGLVLGEGGLPLKIAVVDGPQHVDTTRARPYVRLVATRAIERGEDIAAFPSNLIVHSESLPSPYAAELPAGEAKAGEEDNGWHEYTTLAAWILRERAKGPASDWAPYIALLPKLVPITVTFSDSSLQLFDDEKLLDATNAWKQAIEEEYVKCDPKAIEFALEEDFMWAMSVVISRAFASSSGSKGVEREVGGGLLEEDFAGPSVLVPLADLANHGDLSNWRRYSLIPALPTSHKDGGFVFRATRSVQVGEEILSSYGQHNDRDLVMIYGFLPDCNLDEGVSIADSVEDTMAWVEEHLMQAALKDTAEEQAASLAYAAQTAVEDMWVSLQTKYRELRRKGTSERGDAVPRAELQRAELFSIRAQFQLAPPGDEGRVLAVWPGGQIDPRIIASLAALSFFSRELRLGQPLRRGDLDLNLLANASINYGWAWIRAPCESLVGSSCRRYAQAMTIAGAILQGHIRTLIKGYPTKASADKKCLKKVISLEEQPPTEDLTFDEKREQLAKRCLGELLVRRGVPKHEVVIALKYKLRKKEILQSALERLTLSCGRIVEDEL